MNKNILVIHGRPDRYSFNRALLDAQVKIRDADHIVLIHLVWWGSVPAVLKGFLDRVFLPGFAFYKRKDSLWWEKHLKGKTARIIATLDQPPWYCWLVYWAPSHRVLKKLTFEFCGIKPVWITSFGPV